jgi:hypothetical protein
VQDGIHREIVVLLQVYMGPTPKTAGRVDLCAELGCVGCISENVILDYFWTGKPGPKPVPAACGGATRPAAAFAERSALALAEADSDQFLTSFLLFSPLDLGHSRVHFRSATVRIYRINTGGTAVQYAVQGFYSCTFCARIYTRN